MAIGPLTKEQLRKIADKVMVESRGPGVAFPLTSSNVTFYSSSANYQTFPSARPRIDESEIDRKVEEEVTKRLEAMQEEKEKEAVERLAKTPKILRKLKLEEG